MNMLRSLVGLKGEEKTPETTQVDVPQTIPTEPERPHDDCSGCEDPCDIHPAYPDYLKISKESMAGSVKTHRRHILVAQGKRHQEWIDEVTDVPYRYLHTLSQLVERVTPSLGYQVRVGAVDLDRMQAEDLDEDEVEQFGDIYLFPDQLVFPRVSMASLEDWVRAVLVEDRGRFAMLQTVELRHEQKEKAVNHLINDHAASSSASSETSQLDLEFEHEVIEGLSLLICAHNKRDKRCGITGPMLAGEFESRVAATKALAEQSHNTSINPKVRTFLVSHVGGHKFAGNVIVYPPGLWFGRVKTCHVDTILEAYAPDALPYNATEDRQVIEKRSADARMKLNILKRGEIDW